MPIYEYRCTVCNLRFERKQRVDEDPIRVCPSCNGETRKVLYPVGIIFKGSGFYSTDNRSSSDSNGHSHRTSNGAGEAAKTESGGNGTDSSKPAEKSASTATPSSSAS